MVDLNAPELPSFQPPALLPSLLQSHNPDTLGLAGDVNLFLNKEGEIPEDEYGPCMAAEVSIMIAEKQSQRKGLGQEVVATIMKYGSEKYGITHFIAKISFNNVPSIKIFEEKLGFKRLRVIEAFEEIHLIKKY